MNSINFSKDFGYTFQVKIISSLLTDMKFAATMIDLLKVEYFESTALTWIADYIFNYFTEYKALPTIDAFQVGIGNVPSEMERQELITAFQAVYENTAASDLQFVKDNTLIWCKKQEIRNAIHECSELVLKNDFDAIDIRMKSAMRKGIIDGGGYVYNDTLLNRYNIDQRKCIPTGWGCVNEIIQGGLGVGELGVVVGPGGSGKSWLLQHLGVSAAKDNKRVLYITLELSEVYVAMRMDTLNTNLPNMRLKDNIDKIANSYEEVPGVVTIKWYPETMLSVSGLRGFIDKELLLGNKVDILIVDYADLMKIPGNERERYDQRIKILYQELRGIAGEYQIPVWTASQSTRDSYTEEVIGAEKISESIGKHHTADFMVSLTRKNSDKAANTAKLHIVKNRLGADGMTFIMKMDTNFGVIEVYPSKSREAARLTQKTLDIETKEELETHKKLKDLFEQSKQMLPQWSKQ